MYDKPLVQKLYKKSGILAPKHIGILNHITGVAHVAVYLAHMFNGSNLLQRNHVGIDVTLVATGAMLHDIGKVFDESDQGHVIQGVKFLSEAGVDEKIIDIVERHQPWSFEEGQIPELFNWEQKLVFCADLLFGDHIMPLSIRVNDLIVRYGSHMPRGTQWLKDTSYQLHKEISRIFSPKPFPF